MQTLIFHLFHYAEVYFFILSFCVAALLFALGFYQLKKYPHLALEIRTEKEETKE